MDPAEPAVDPARARRHTVLVLRGTARQLDEHAESFRRAASDDPAVADDLRHLAGALDIAAIHARRLAADASVDPQPPARLREYDRVRLAYADIGAADITDAINAAVARLDAADAHAVELRHPDGRAVTVAGDRPAAGDAPADRG